MWACTMQMKVSQQETMTIMFYHYIFTVSICAPIDMHITVKVKFLKWSAED